MLGTSEHHPRRRVDLRPKKFMEIRDANSSSFGCRGCVLCRAALPRKLPRTPDVTVGKTVREPDVTVEETACPGTGRGITRERHPSVDVEIVETVYMRDNYFTPLTATMLNFAYFSPIFSAA